MQSEDNKETIKYGQIPTELITDKELLGEEKNFFCYCHSLKGDKDFRENPNPVRNVSRKEAMKSLGFSGKTITNWTNRLQARGWISISYQGCKGYIIILHANRKRRKSAKNDV